MSNFIHTPQSKPKSKKAWKKAKKITKRKASSPSNKPKTARKPKVPKEIKDAETVLAEIPSKGHIEKLSMEELTTLFARILESEQGLCREKEGFIEKYYEHCEALRHISAAKRVLNGEPPREDTPYWASHPSRTWRNTQI